MYKKIHEKKITGIIITHVYDLLTENSIKSLMNFCSEIIIVQSLGTIGILSSNLKSNSKIRIIKVDTKLNHSELRNIGLKNAKYNWIFFLDSDESLSEDLIKETPKLIKNNNILGYWFSRRNYYRKGKYFRYGLFYPDFQLRLFQNIGYYFYNPIHPHIDIPDNLTAYKNLDILHFSRNSKYARFLDFKNFLTYIQIEGDELAKKEVNLLRLLYLGLTKFISLFFSGYFRGKGFLDGWAGFRAHVIFSLYISSIYFFAFFKIIHRNFIK